MPIITETFKVVPTGDGELLAVVECPMCGFKAAWTFKPHTRRVILCPCEEGGCDRYYVASLSIKADVRTFTINE